MKILLIRFSSIGDIVLTTPVIRCLKTQLPDAEIHYCTKSSYKTLLRANPYIDKLHLLDDDIHLLAESLTAEKYDWVIDLHNNLRTFVLKFRIGCPSKSFDKLNWQKWLLVNLEINKMPRSHIVERYMATVEHLAVNYDGLGLDHFIPNEDMVDISSLPSHYHREYVVYAIGGQHETKKLPIAKMKELVGKISHPVILLGGKEDEANGDLLVSNNTEDKWVLNLCGKLNINQSASILQQSQKVYTHDTGLMHIAAAFRKEIISIWGNTTPLFGMYPFQTKYEVWEVEGLSCRPCSKIGFSKCPKGHFNCMNLQTLPVHN